MDLKAALPLDETQQHHWLARAPTQDRRQWAAAEIRRMLGATTTATTAAEMVVAETVGAAMVVAAVAVAATVVVAATAGTAGAATAAARTASAASAVATLKLEKGLAPLSGWRM